MQKSGFRLDRIGALALTLVSAIPMPGLAQQNDAPELTVKASQAIDKGLKHLLANQRDDGSWASGENGERATPMTALALMAFMARAEFPGSGPNGKALARAKDWLLNQAKEAPNGYLGSTMYEHAMATLALTELWGMTGAKEDDDALQKAIEAAIDVILRSQTAAGGWRYQPTPSGGNDTSATGTVFVALASARQAGIAVPNETIAKVLSYLKLAANPKTGGFIYVPLGSGQAGTDSLGSTAAGAYAAQLAGARESEMVEGALRYLEERAPAIFQGCGFYYYCHYYALQAMVQSGDERYAKWYPQIRDALISRQTGSGSWAGKVTDKTPTKAAGLPIEDQSVQASAASKIIGHETPMAIIMLAAPYRYIPIYQK
jgi:uncharacterized protein YfaS (alpha-2-macroglobulin family)